MCIISGHSLTVQFECIARMFFFSLHHALIRELFRNFHTHAQRRSGGQSLGEGFFWIRSEKYNWILLFKNFNYYYFRKEIAVSRFSQWYIHTYFFNELIFLQKM